jgi:hypothetical protein
MRALRNAAAAALVAIALGATACAPPPTPPTPATGRFVAPTGSDSGTCATQATACRTINYAASQATPGQTVHVAAGTYDEMVTVDKPLEFRGANVGRAAGVSPNVRVAESVVKGFRSPSTGAHPTAAHELSVTIDGFTIDPQGDASLLSATTQHLVSLFGGDDVSVRNNIFVGGTFDPACGAVCTTMTDSAFMVQSGTFEVVDNSFTNFRRPVDIAQFDAANPIVAGTVSGNSFQNVTSRAVWLLDWTQGGYKGISVTGNAFDGTSTIGQPSRPAGVVVSTGGNVISDNTFTGLGSGVFAEVCNSFWGLPDPAPNQYLGNEFTGNSTAINYFVVATADCDPVNGVNAVITGNDFVGNTTAGVRWNQFGAAAPNDLDATCNWWGQATGPNTPGADAATPGVITSPWLTASGGACDGN